MSRGVVVEAYAQLAAEGYLLTRRGGGTFVAAATANVVTRQPRPTLRLAASAAPRYDLRPALPALDGAFRPAWGTRARPRAADDARRAARLPRPARGAGAAGGAGRVARAPARRAGDGRTRCVVTGGLGPSLPFVWRLLAARGIARVAIEDPCWPRLTRTAGRRRPAGRPARRSTSTACRRDALRDVGAVFVTPAHQYPTGAVLSPARRAALIEWARRHDAFVFEDDYDAEFRYDRQPVGSLQGLAPDVVVYGGSTSKTLAPGPAARVARAAEGHRRRAARPAAGARPARARRPDRRAATSTATCATTAASTSGAARRCWRALARPPARSRDLRRRRRPARRPACHDRRARGAAAARAHGVALDAIDGRLIVGYANLPESQAPAAVEALAAALG